MISPIAMPFEETPGTRPSCAAESGLCDFVYDQTKNKWLAESSYWVLVKPLTIITIIIVALIIRALIHRAIDRLIKHTVADSENGGSILRPLRRRLPTLAAPSERRNQRARALGSVLRSIASAVVFSIATMLVLGEIGINLGPLLASAGIAGLAIGFGAQNLVKDFIAGLFMLLEDQYGVGDVVDVGEVTGTVEAVGLRITTVRDGTGVVWYVRNGEIVRVGNKSQGWAVVNIDVPVGFVSVDQATAVLQETVEQFAADADFADDFMDPPKVLGVEQLTAEGAVLRVTVKTSNEAQWRIGRELRRRTTDALERAGITAQLTAARMYIRPANGDETGPAGPT
ncbi:MULTISPECIES: mechanosensitive ion channel family protein [Dactylosporangium]|uniref:Mechanosensitive ion channel protein MscS n=2 Tax=Dactylosporangium TaxID=35753 RepID=A0A9W6NL27_9ACTN|nr:MULTISPECIES: mechanosensitive ion channel family protein [Dactylosporangium]GLL00701.1 mechanosensitive ion channel protein MscS [Dactylosporangium matsuzakiense]